MVSCRPKWKEMSLHYPFPAEMDTYRYLEITHEPETNRVSKGINKTGLVMCMQWLVTNGVSRSSSPQRLLRTRCSSPAGSSVPLLWRVHPRSGADENDVDNAAGGRRTLLTYVIRPPCCWRRCAWLLELGNSNRLQTFRFYIYFNSIITCNASRLFVLQRCRLLFNYNINQKGFVC